MKNIFKLLTTGAMALAAIFPAHADKLTVCEGDQLSFVSPINSNWVDTQGTRTQVIYPASYLTSMVGQAINSVKFYTDADGFMIDGGQLAVSMGETAMSSFSSQYASGLTRVATLTMVAGGVEVLIEFDTPYIYNGGNLVIETLVEQETDYATTFFTGIRTETYNSLSRSELERFIPKTTFDFGQPQTYGAKVEPQSLDLGAVHIGKQASGTVVLTNIGTMPFTPHVGSPDAPFSIQAAPVEMVEGATLPITVTFTPTRMGEFSSTLSINCGPAGTLSVPVTGTALEAVTDLTVCDSTAINTTVPVFGLYYDYVDVMGQMIYPEAMLTDMVGKQMVALTFYARNQLQIGGGNIQLSLKTTNKSSFTNAVAETGLTVVANAVPVDDEQELTFVFDEPFEYTGGNLVVEALVTQAGNPGTTRFLGVETDNNASYYYYEAWGSNHELVKFLPKATFTYEIGGTPDVEVMIGDVDGNKSVNIGDVAALINYLLSDPSAAPESADCTQDHNVNVADIAALVNYLLTQAW